jgi:HK97 gp10 family phage protein
MAVRVVLIGVKELDRLLKGLEPRVARKVIRQAMRRALRPVMAAVQRNAPVDTGTLKAAIKLRAARARKRGQIILEVRIGEGDFKGKQFYAAMVEYGTSKQPAQGFMRRAFDATGDAAKRQALGAIMAGIEREAAR